MADLLLRMTPPDQPLFISPCPSYPSPMQSLILSDNQSFDLASTLSCGQVFGWEQTEGGWWQGSLCRSVMRVRQEDRTLLFEGVDEETLVRYFALDLDLNKILSSVSRDEFIAAAIESRRGLRIVRQDPWECLLSYLCAQNANIPFITRMLSSLRQNFGDKLDSPWGTFQSLPRPEVLAALSHEDIATCRPGYRGSYILGTARQIASDPGWEMRIRELPYQEAADDLMKLSGVGPKVADCLLLFGFQKYEAFPVDVWIRRIMQEHYLSPETSCTLTRSAYRRIGTFSRDYFGDYAGYAQEYLYAARSD